MKGLANCPHPEEGHYSIKCGGGRAGRTGQEAMVRERDMEILRFLMWKIGRNVKYSGSEGSEGELRSQGTRSEGYQSRASNN